jgi:hypothetical protein
MISRFDVIGDMPLLIDLIDHGYLGGDQAAHTVQLESLGR